MCAFLLLNSLFFQGCKSNTQIPDISKDDTFFTLRLASAFHIPGVQVALFNADSILEINAWGTASASGNENLSTSHVMESASLSKPLFARFLLSRYPDILSARLSDLSRFETMYPPVIDSRYRSLNTYLNSPEKQQFLESKVIEILNHSAGFGDWWNSDFELRQAGIFHYSDEGYIALQRCIENREHKRIDSLLLPWLASNYGVKNISFSGRKDPTWLISDGHTADGAFKRHAWIAEEPFVHGSMLASIEDLALFYQSLLSAKNDRLSRIMLSTADSLCVPVDEFPGLFWGCGLGQERLPDDTLYWQWGNDTHFQHLLPYSSRDRRGILIQTNSANGLYFIEDYVKRKFYEPDLKLFNFIRS